MTIKEAEALTGLSRSNIRFYEKEKLIVPSRNENNGYRDYSEQDVENIKKIAYLRTLGLSIEDIRNIISEKITLREAISRQHTLLSGQISDLRRAKVLCERMLASKNLPPKIPVQWNNGIASSLADKRFIFAYPIMCILIRFLLRQFIFAKIQINSHYGELITEYLTNYLCFVALSVEVFSILFICGIVKNVVLLLFADTVVLIGLLITGLVKNHYSV